MNHILYALLGPVDTEEGPKEYSQEGHVAKDPEDTVTNKHGVGNERAGVRKRAKPKWLRDYIH